MNRYVCSSSGFILPLRDEHRYGAFPLFSSSSRNQGRENDLTHGDIARIPSTLSLRLAV